MAQKGNLQIPFVLRPVGFLGEGQNRYVASVERYSTIGYNEIVAYAARAAHVPETDITMAMDALFDALSYFVCNGHGVKLPNLGVFTFGINAKAEVSEAAAGADAVYRTKVNFVPNRELRDVLDNVAISTLPLNPNGLSEGVATSARVLGINLKVNKSTFSPTIGRTYSIGDTVRVVVKLSAPLAAAPIVVLRTSSNRMYSRNTVMIGSNAIADFDGVLAVGETATQLAGIAVYDSESLMLYDMPFSCVNGSFEPFAVEFMGARRIIKPVDDNNMFIAVNPTSGKRYLDMFAANAAAANIGNLIKYDGVVVTAPEVISTGLDFIRVVVPDTVREVSFVENAFNTIFTVAEDEEGSIIPVVNSLSANGVTIRNNGTSTIVDGSSYNFTLRGKNLNLLQTIPSAFGGLVTEAGAVITIMERTDTQIDFMMTNAKAGEFEIRNDDTEETYFKVTLTAYAPAENAPTISSIQGVSNNGSLYVATNAETVLNIAGTNLASLNKSNFSIGSGEIVALTPSSATAATVTVRSTAGSNPLRYTINGSVIFQLTLTNTTGDNIGGIPIIPGDGFLD